MEFQFKCKLIKDYHDTCRKNLLKKLNKVPGKDPNDKYLTKKTLDRLFKQKKHFTFLPLYFKRINENEYKGVGKLLTEKEEFGQLNCTIKINLDKISYFIIPSLSNFERVFERIKIDEKLYIDSTVEINKIIKINF